MTRRHCEVCHFEVEGTGPWCRLYCKEAKQLCWSILHESLEHADARGDGPWVNAICEKGRELYGPCLHW